MANENLPANPQSATDAVLRRIAQRRSFLKGVGIAGAAISAGALLTTAGGAEEKSGSLTRGDAAILRFLAAAEIIESDLWLQYAELGGVPDSTELPQLASQLIPGYPNQPFVGNDTYISALEQLDSDMPQYIHDNTEDELTHENFINAYLVMKGADPVNLDKFRTLPSSTAPGAFSVGRLTNLMQLTVDTSWWTRYRSRTKNPDLDPNFVFPPAIPSLAGGMFTAIPRNFNDSDPNNANNSSSLPLTHIQAIANTAGFHFAFIEQGGTSLYPSLAQRVTSLEVLRILLSIGGTEICHFQTWHDKAGNAITGSDPENSALVFPDLNDPTQIPSNLVAKGFTLEDFQTNLIMPEPTAFLSRRLPVCSIIRPTETRNAAMGAVKALTDDGLFIGQSKQFFKMLQDLASDADEAQREF